MSILCMILIYETSLMLLPAAGSLKPDDVAICISVIKLIDFKKIICLFFSNGSTLLVINGFSCEHLVITFIQLLISFYNLIFNQTT